MPHPSQDIVSDYMPTPAAAYSLRSLDGSTSTNVVRLRRASDNEESDFTAADLVGSVEGSELVTNGDFATDTDWSKGANWTITGGQAVSDGTVDYGALRQNLSGNLTAGAYYKLTFDIVACSDFDGLGLQIEGSAVNATNRSVGTGMEVNSTGSHSVIFLAGGSGVNFAWFTTTGTTATIDNVGFKPYTPTAAELWAIEGIAAQSRFAKTTTESALVTTLYDQASTNDATQSTAAAQPKLITAGVTELENGKPAMVFDSSASQELLLSSNPLSTMNNLMVSTVYAFRETPTAVEYITAFNKSPNRLYVPADISTAKRIAYIGSNSIEGVGGATLNTSHLSTLSVDSTTAVGYYDGAKYSNKNDVSAISDALTLAEPSIGSLGGSSYSDGVVQEIIVYDSDQSANRTIIETNINDHYGIY